MTQSAFDATQGQLKPEQSRIIEGGYRVVRRQFEASAALYDVKFDHRLLSLNPCPSIQQGTSLACTTRFWYPPKLHPF